MSFIFFCANIGLISKIKKNNAIKRRKSGKTLMELTIVHKKNNQLVLIAICYLLPYQDSNPD